MAATIFGYIGNCVTFAHAFKFGIMTCQTGIGIAIAIAAELGFSCSLFMVAHSLTYFGLAAWYYAKHNSFELESVSICGFTRYTYVGRVY